MQGIELIVALLLASTVLAGLARAIHVHYAIVLVLGGLAVGLVSGTSAPEVDPHTVLFVFLPPLIYAASFSSSTQDLRTHARAIGLLAVGLVLLSMTAVAAVAHAVAGIGWGPALVLGAILGPTDPIAATSVLRRLGAPDRISTILEGEALINAGTGLTVYKLAVAAVVSGHFSPGAGIVKFIAVAAGGVAVGLAAGWVSVEIRKRIDEPQIEISISLLTAYLAYIPADRIGAWGYWPRWPRGYTPEAEPDRCSRPPPVSARSDSGRRSRSCSSRSCSCSSDSSSRTSRAVCRWKGRFYIRRRSWPR